VNRYKTTAMAVLVLWALPIASLLTNPPDLGCDFARLRHVFDSGCWCVWPCQCWGPHPRSSTELQMGRVAERLQIHVVKHGEFPRALSEVEPGWDPRDAWGNAFEYSLPRANMAVLTSHGWDGMPGNACAIGEAEDLTYPLSL